MSAPSHGNRLAVAWGSRCVPLLCALCVPLLASAAFLLGGAAARGSAGASSSAAAVAPVLPGCRPWRVGCVGGGPSRARAADAALDFWAQAEAAQRLEETRRATHAFFQALARQRKEREAGGGAGRGQAAPQGAVAEGRPAARQHSVPQEPLDAALPAESDVMCSLERGRERQPCPGAGGAEPLTDSATQGAHAAARMFAAALQSEQQHAAKGRLQAARA